LRAIAAAPIEIRLAGRVEGPDQSRRLAQEALGGEDFADRWPTTSGAMMRMRLVCSGPWRWLSVHQDLAGLSLEAGT
jgi:hypothetical protein